MISREISRCRRISAGFFLRTIYLSDGTGTQVQKREENMTTKLTALLCVLAVGTGLSTAVAQQAPTENKGMKVEALSGFQLGKQGLDDFSQRQMRIRQITVEPGGVAGFHSHKDRPALTYVMKGSLMEHRKGSPDRTYKAGEVITESTDVDHWAENTSSEPVVLISADLFKE
jgi:quercetin dioxygenase-like cupin family protein